MRRPITIMAASGLGLGLLLTTLGMATAQEETPYQCKSVSTAGDPNTQTLFGVLGVTSSVEADTPVGLNCTPGSSDEATNFCGTGQDDFNGVVVIGGKPGSCGG